MTDQSISQAEPAGFVTYFHEVSNQSGLGLSDDGEFTTQLQACCDCTGEFCIGYEGASATDSATLTGVGTGLDFPQDVPLDFDNFEYLYTLEAVPQFGVGFPVAGEATGEATGSYPFDNHAGALSNGATDVFSGCPTPELTQASSPRSDVPLPGQDCVAIIDGSPAKAKQSTGPAKLMCDLCPTAVKDSRSLERHKKEAHGTKRYRCRCWYSSPRKSNYTRHLRTCKRKESPSAESDFFQCYCGERQAGLGDHEHHVARCGLGKVGRPARGAVH